MAQNRDAIPTSPQFLIIREKCRFSPIVSRENNKFQLNGALATADMPVEVSDSFV